MIFRKIKLLKQICEEIIEMKEFDDDGLSRLNGVVEQINTEFKSVGMNCPCL